MSYRLPTVKIATDTPKGFRIINESDFDPDVHDLFDEPALVEAVEPTDTDDDADKDVDPLDALPDNWRDTRGAGVAKLKDIAAAVSGGRVPENKAQAVEMIDAALAERDADEETDEDADDAGPPGPPPGAAAE